jgi:glycosyltransferase involved in cell wall biosynthesis
MNILHLGCGYKPENCGNATRMSSLLESTSLENNHFVLTHSRRKYFDDDKYYEDKGIKLIRISGDREVLAVLKKVVKEFNIDIIQAHNFKTAIIASLLTNKRIRIIFEIHSWIETTKIKTIIRDFFLKKFVFKRVDRIFILSLNLKKFLINNYKYPPEKIFFMPNGYLHKNKQYRFKRSVNTKFFTFGYVGSYFDWQGIGNLMTIIPSIYNKFPNSRFLMVGDGVDFKRFKDFVIKNNFSDRVIMTGMVSKDELVKYYDEIDVILIPRPKTLETENSIPLKIFEAVWYCKPIIMSDVKGLIEVLGSDEALIYKSESLYELQEFIIKIFKNYTLMEKLSKNAFNKIIRWPTWRNIAEKQETIYKVLMKSKN